MKKVNLILGALALTAVVVSCTKEDLVIKPNDKSKKNDSYTIENPTWVLVKKQTIKNGMKGNLFVNSSNPKEYLFEIDKNEKAADNECDKNYEKNSALQTTTCSGTGNTCSITEDKNGDITISTCK